MACWKVQTQSIDQGLAGLLTKKSFKQTVLFLRWDHSEVQYASESFCYLNLTSLQELLKGARCKNFS